MTAISAATFQGLSPYFDLYNQFRIIKCYVSIVPSKNVNTAVWDGTDALQDNIQTIVSAPAPSVADFFDSPPTVPGLRSYYRSKETRFNRPHRRSFKPYIQVQETVLMDNGTTTQTTARNIYSPWLATNDDGGSLNTTDLQHYGLFWGVAAMAGDDTQTGQNVQTILRATFQFKNPKPLV